MADITIAGVQRTKDGLVVDTVNVSTVEINAAEPVRLRITDKIGRRRPEASLEAKVQAPTRSGRFDTVLRERREMDAAGDLTFHLIGFPPGRHTVRFEIAVDEAVGSGLVKRRQAKGTLTLVAQ